MKLKAMNLSFAVLSLVLMMTATVFFWGCDGGGGCGGGIDPGLAGIRPIVFVHGMAGSGDQFETQALRFASNGYPEDYFTGFDHNTIVDQTREERLDATIDEVLRTTGADKVDLVGHSMGTGVSQNYLSDSAHAAKVAHYVNVDGVGSGSLPGGVPTMSIIATSIGGSISGAQNVRLKNHTHVQGVSSPEAFEHMFKFFTGKAPATTEIQPSDDQTITLKGRLVTFITNVVPPNGTISVYEVDRNTGHRLSNKPAYVKQIGEDGNFNFTNAKQGATYEFCATRPTMADQGHWFYEPFSRTDTLIRLKFEEPGSLLFNMIDSSDDTSALIIVRNREMEGEGASGLGVDSIKINGTEVCEGILPGGSGVNNSGPIGLMIFDADSDGVSDLSGVGDAFKYIPFVNSVDLVMPASPTADGVISIVVKDRYSKKTQSINVPNYSSTVHKMFAQFLSL